MQYSNLPPKKYRFRVIASNNSGVWNETGDYVGVFHRPGILPDKLLPRSVRGCVLPDSLGTVSLPPPSDRAGIQRATRGTSRGAHAHRPRVARHPAAKLPSRAIRISGGAGTSSPKAAKRRFQTLDSAISTAQGAIVEGRDAIHDLRHTAGPQAHLENLLKTAGQELASSEVSNGNHPAFRVTVEGPAQTLSPAASGRGLSDWA